MFRVARSSGAALVYKEPLGANARARLRHEKRILERLTGIAGVPRLALASPAGSIAFEDDAGVALSTFCRNQSFAGPALLDFAHALSLILAAVHRAGVVHKDVNPANILVAGARNEPVLIDYELATTSAEERPSFVHQNDIAGTLAYVAPEQTGRTGKSVDQRADLYSLGIVLYELTTGRRPFAGRDALQLIHDHIARVPNRPQPLDPALPAALADVIVKLLQKEPDRRYQSAEGLAHDLARLREPPSRAGRPFVIGERDYPLRLRAPSRLIGREMETAALREAFQNAVTGDGGGIFVAGAPGVGKTVLIDQLRPLVTARAGSLVSGKFDRYRADAVRSVVLDTLGGLGRLLLAEDDAEVTTFRECALEALGGNAGVLAAVVPEFAALLGTKPQRSHDPALAEAQLRTASVELVRCAAARHPLVMFLDDLQWADASALAFIDAVLTDGQSPGFFLVGAYRACDVGPMHPLGGLQARWKRLGVAPPTLALAELTHPAVGELLAEMLRLPPIRAASLAKAIGEQTRGNPYDTVEFVNALRHDGLLVSGTAGWVWDDAAVRRFVGSSQVTDLLAARIERLPQPSRNVLETMACLGSETPLRVLEAAEAVGSRALEEALAPPLEDGLLVMNEREGAIRFRHDRVRDAAYDRLEGSRRREVHLGLARRLGESAAFGRWAAEHYAQALDAVDDARECRRAMAIFAEAAAHARRASAYDTVVRFTSAALALLARAASPGDVFPRAALLVEQHEALCLLSRYDEADAVYASLVAEAGNLAQLTGAARVQIRGLQHRNRHREAVALCSHLFERLGLDRRTRGSKAQIALGIGELARWMQDPQAADRENGWDVSGGGFEAAAPLAAAVMSSALACDPELAAWLVVESIRLWRRCGPSAPLVVMLGYASTVVVLSKEDYRTGYLAMKFAIGAGEARRYEPETSRARMNFGNFAQHWFEPLEAAIEPAQLVREGPLRGVESQGAGLTYLATLAAIFDSAASLETLAAELEAAVAFAAKTGNEFLAASFHTYADMLNAFRGDVDWKQIAHRAAPAALSENGVGGAGFHITSGIVAAVFGDAAALAYQTAAALPLLPNIGGAYRTALAYLLRSLALADAIRAALPDRSRGQTSELRVHRAWFAARALDAPMNFSHLSHLVEAEYAWTRGDRWNAALAFDLALRDAAVRNRPWHYALIAERASRFFFATGLEDAGREALVRARDAYERWGAVGKVRQLEATHAFLEQRASPDVRSGGTGSVSSQSVDLLAILQASQALSSETNLDRLRARISESLAAISGATAVTLALEYDAPLGWCVLPPAGGGDAPISVDSPAAAEALPLSAFRYVRRIGEPLLVKDATRDERFAADPYVAKSDYCSLLVVPILSQGTLRAILVLENRLGVQPFSESRLDAVTLVAGQLAVSLDNALLYASLEQKVAERTEALEAANERLAALSTTDALTGIANRRRFDEALESEWRRAQRSGGSIALAMIDVDDFKCYNDRYGHILGDAALRRVAVLLGEAVRQGLDVPARYGGEEFAIVLPGLDIEGALLAAERIRRGVASLHQPHEASGNGFVSVSVGVSATVPASGQSAQALIARADAALYRAKGSGRNCVRTDDRENPSA